MNIPEDKAKEIGYEQQISHHEMPLKMILGGNIKSLYSFDTYQFKDYTKVVSDLFNVEQKAKRREEVFPKDCKKARELGENLVTT
ncbi:MAG: hypothetical protein FH758_05140 [Firmicutes bacterium]|nr:hypothetical protein [Bacillota bacterium]